MGPEQGSAPIIPLEQQQKIEETLDASYKAALPKFDDAMSISSDSEGEVPLSPASRLDDDDVHEQVTICRWSHCKAGNQGNMDQLVEHVHNEHIELRGKKYTCEWSDCSRKGLPHASAYALKAHMRSHTREKPFYCTLPEYDRAFTRSDALAKHHRTVHETEALRPSDPIPKSMSAAHKNQRLKLNVKAEQPEGHLPGPAHVNGTTNGHGPLGHPGWTSSYPVQLGFTAEEEARGPKELFFLLRNEIEWAQEESVGSFHTVLIIASSLIYNSYRDFHSHPNIACRIKSTPTLFTQRKHMRYGIVKEQYQYRCSPLSLFVSISSAVDFPSQTLNMRHGSLRTSPYRGNYSSGPAHRKDVEKEGYQRLDAQKDQS